MSLTPFFGRNFRNGSIWDPLPSFGGSVFDPWESFSSGFDHPLGRNSTSVDWVETPEAHVFKADLPGMKKEEIKVEVLDGRTLRISGERNKELTQEKDAWRCVERSHGKFLRQFGLPDNAKVEQVAAKVDNGVLTVTIPKSESIITPPVRVVEIA